MVEQASAAARRPRRGRLRAALAWIAAAALTAVLGSIIQTQLNLAALQALGVPVPLGVRGEATLHDLLGFAPLFMAIVLAGFAIALPNAAWLARRLGGARSALFTLAGAAAVAVALLAMNFATGITPVAAARTGTGLLALTAAGAAGGYLFAWALPGGRGG